MPRIEALRPEILTINRQIDGAGAALFVGRAAALEVGVVVVDGQRLLRRRAAQVLALHVRRELGPALEPLLEADSLNPVIHFFL